MTGCSTCSRTANFLDDNGGGIAVMHSLSGWFIDWFSKMVIRA